jgi:hypothetical protein
LHCKLKDIRSFALYDCEGFRVLALQRGDKHVLVGVPLHVEVADLGDFLVSRGLIRTEPIRAE